MIININKLKEIAKIKATNEQLIAAFTNLGFEVERVIEYSKLNKGIVVGFIEKATKIEGTHLTLCTVNVKNEKLSILCGAENARSGIYVIVAKIGAVLHNNFLIAKRKMLGKYESEGMICSLKELGIKSTDKGIYEFQNISDKKIGNSNPLKLIGFDGIDFELSFTTNRNDANSYYVIAKELSSYFNKPIKLPTISFKNKKTNFKLDKDHIDFFSLTKFKVKTPTKSQVEKLSKEMSIFSVNSVNNFYVDFANLVTAISGNPLHIYDSKLINLNNLKIEKYKLNESHIFLDGVMRNIHDTLTLSSNNVPLCVVGISGLKQSQLPNNTVEFYLESAIFDQEIIRKTSIKLNFTSTASKLFSRKGSIFNAKLAIQIFIDKLKEYKLLDKVDVSLVHENIIKESKIKISKEYIAQRIGMAVDIKKIITNFKNLDYKVSENKSEIELIKPNYRNDIFNKEDILEEIIRFIDLNKIPAQPITLTTQRVEKDFLQNFKPYAKNILAIRHFREVQTYNLVPETYVQQKWNWWNADNTIKVDNAISENRKFWKVTNTLNMFEIMNYNLARSSMPVHIFEFSTIYKTPTEPINLLTIATNSLIEVNIQTNLRKGAHITALSEEMRLFTNYFGIKNLVAKQSFHKHKFTNPYLQVEFFHNDKLVGKAYRLGDANDLPMTTKGLNDVTICELNISELATHPIPIAQMQPLSDYPTVKRDYNFIFNDDVKAGEIKAEIKKLFKDTFGKVHLEINFFDKFISPELKKQKQYALAFSIIYKFFDKTANETDINLIHNKIIKSLEVKFKATLRLNA